jgi:hypothetical protein
MQNISLFIQLFGASVFTAFLYNVALLIVNQLKTK